MSFMFSNILYELKCILLRLINNAMMRFKEVFKMPYLRACPCLNDYPFRFINIIVKRISRTIITVEYVFF